MLTGTDGGYQFFWRSPPVNDVCTYEFSVTPPSLSGYVSPSTALPPQGCLVHRLRAWWYRAADPPQPGTPAGLSHASSLGRQLPAARLARFLHNHIPLDRGDATASLVLRKGVEQA